MISAQAKIDLYVNGETAQKTLTRLKEQLDSLEKARQVAFKAGDGEDIEKRLSTELLR